MKSIFLFLFFSTISTFITFSQTGLERDALLGGYLPERTNWNLIHYNFTIQVKPKEQNITGVNHITFELLDTLEHLQIDLHENLSIDSIVLLNNRCAFTREFSSIFIAIPLLSLRSREILSIYYHGNPIIAKNPPWDGGYTTQLDKNGKYQIGMAVQGEGGSIWLPMKDGQSDEPEEGVIANIIVPSDLVAVSNGRLIEKNEMQDGLTKWTWQVTNPINSYCITFNIGDYVSIHRRYKNLDLTYWVLKSNKELAKLHFTIVPEMLSIFEKFFGPYPFPEDGYKIVETSFAGMEHQSNIAYGNYFKNGYAGHGNEIARRFDFILIHESAHEWFGNSITSKDIADMWIHEAFTTYAEFLYVEEKWGGEAALKYMEQVLSYIKNESPIIGKYACNHKGDTDMYYKGALMLQTLRSHIDNDSLFFKTLFNFSLHFKKQIIESIDVIQFFSDNLKQDLIPFFSTYLNQSTLPCLAITDNNEVFFTNVQPGFTLNVDLKMGKKMKKYLINETPLKIKKASILLKEKNTNQVIDQRKFLITIDPWFI